MMNEGIILSRFFFFDRSTCERIFSFDLKKKKKKGGKERKKICIFENFETMDRTRTIFIAWRFEKMARNMEKYESGISIQSMERGDRYE